MSTTQAEASHGSANGLKVDQERARELSDNINDVIKRIEAAKGQSDRPVRLIAVSKLKPANDILALCSGTSTPSPQTQLHFGENYAQELIEKSKILPPEIKWHMIGGLQTNKCRPLAETVRNLYCVSSVDSIKKADALEKGRATLADSVADKDQDGAIEEKLRVLVQVNTSGEENKSGVEPGTDAVELCKHIREKCPHLQLAGLMTIGAIARSKASTPETENEDFVTLRQVRDNIAKDIGLDRVEELELSMGMSADFEAAIKQGSDEVRVGTTIFGQRPPKKDAKVKNEAEDAKS